jgi:hypothetical protein
VEDPRFEFMTASVPLIQTSWVSLSLSGGARFSVLAGSSLPAHK